MAGRLGSRQGRCPDVVQELSQERSPLSYAVIGAAMEVHNELGSGFLEAVYQEALGNELGRRGIRYRREMPVPIHYKGDPLGTPYRADFLVDGHLLVELKAVAGLGRIEEAQVIHYLKATRLPAGLLINFGAASLQVRRLGNRKTMGGAVAMEFP
jgi:GxxExxY protein